jgi:hypothetical protein
MSLDLAQMLAQLEAKATHNREQQALHAEREAFHRDKAAHHTSELEAALASLEALRTAVETAGELLGRDRSALIAAASDDELDVRRKRSLSRMVARVIEGLGPDETFGATSVTRSIEERWGAKLRRRPDPRSVAASLRRWAAAGRLHQVREGRAHHEALYRKRPPG